MKFYLISDDKDTVTGMRLAGIEGELVESASAASAALSTAMSNKDVGIVLITKDVSDMCAEQVLEIKQTVPSPLLVQVPDSKSNGSNTDSIMEYVNNAIGVKM